MSSCGQQYCPGGKSCFILHPFNKSRRQKCERIRACQARVCSTLSSLGDEGFVLYDSCLGACHDNEEKYKTANEWLCDNYNGGELVYYYGVNPCNTDISKVPTAETLGQLDKTAAKSNILYVAFAAVIVLVSIILITRK
jgi:hypothetical protein